VLYELRDVTCDKDLEISEYRLFSGPSPSLLLPLPPSLCRPVLHETLLWPHITVQGSSSASILVLCFHNGSEL
jgi:hypothetical protein